MRHLTIAKFAIVWSFRFAKEKLSFPYLVGFEPLPWDYQRARPLDCGGKTPLWIIESGIMLPHSKDG